MHTQGNLLGIEHTEIFQPGPPDGASLQAQDNLRQAIVRKANSLYLNRYIQPLLVQVLFNDRYKINKKDQDHLAERIMPFNRNNPYNSG